MTTATQSTTFYDLEGKDLSEIMQLQSTQVAFKLPPLSQRDCACFYKDPLQNSVLFSLQCLPKDFLFLILKTKNNFLVFMLNPFSSKNSRYFWEEDLLHIHTQIDKSIEPNVFIKKGKDLRKVIKALLLNLQELYPHINILLENKLSYPEWISNVGWEINKPTKSLLSARYIIKKAKEIIANGINPSYLLIKEGWQHCLDDLSLASFEADPIRFPMGIKHLVQELKKIGIEHVGFEHSLFGAKRGLSTKLAQRYLFKKQDNGYYFPCQKLGNSFEFFHDYYKSLKSQGVCFVQTFADNSSFFKVKSSQYKQLYTAYQTASSLFFQGVSWITPPYFKGGLSFYSYSRFATTAAKPNCNNLFELASYIYQTLANSLWLQHSCEFHLTATLQKQLPQSTWALFHCLSKGSLLLSGELCKEQKKEISKFLISNQKPLQADFPLTITSQSLLKNEEDLTSLLISYSQSKNSSIIALFNLHMNKRTLCEYLNLEEIPFPEKSPTYLGYSLHHGFLGKIQKKQPLKICIKPLHSDLISLIPYQQNVVIIGHFTLALPLAYIDKINLEDDELHFYSSIKGPILIYCEREVLEITRNNKLIPWNHDSKNHLLTLHQRCINKTSESHYTVIFH
jgi:hypothetical protein